MKKLSQVVMAIVILGIVVVAGIKFMFTQPVADAQSAGNFTSLTSTFNPPTQTLTTTCTTTGCPTFVFTGLCTAVLRVGGTNSAINIVAKVSNDAASNYSQIIPLVVGVTTNGTITSNAIAANGLYSMTLSGMNRLRLEVGTLTGTNVTLKLTATNACISQAL